MISSKLVGSIYNKTRVFECLSSFMKFALILWYNTGIYLAYACVFMFAVHIQVTLKRNHKYLI